MQAAISTLPPRARGSFRVMPGFGLSLGFTVFYLSLIVLIPLSAVFFKTFTMTWEAFWSAVTSDRVMASYRLTFGASLIAAELVFGATSGKGGLGWYIFQNRNELYTDKVFAGLALVILIGLVVENLVFRTLERVTVLRWGMQR